MKKVLLLSLIVGLLFSCAINQLLTPGVKTRVSDFNNSIEVIQKPVSAANSFDEAWHTLGFLMKLGTH